MVFVMNVREVRGEGVLGRGSGGGGLLREL